jgi:hypothetical protein
MATKFEFLSNFDYDVRTPKGVVVETKAYRAGTTVLVPEEHAKAAEEAKAGRRVEEAKPAGKAKE